MLLDGVNNEIFRKITSFGYAVGFFSEMIIFIIVVCLLFKQHLDLSFYLLGLLITSLINRLLKVLIKQDRPTNPIKFLQNEMVKKNGNTYGMPSGHSQTVFFSLTYLYLTTTKDIYWLLLGLVIGGLMFVERLVFHNHTFLQLLAGAIIGTILAYVVVKIKDQFDYYLSK
jgi:hypothetical protein